MIGFTKPTWPSRVFAYFLYPRIIVLPISRILIHRLAYNSRHLKSDFDNSSSSVLSTVALKTTNSFKGKARSTRAIALHSQRFEGHKFGIPQEGYIPLLLRLKYALMVSVLKYKAYMKAPLILGVTGLVGSSFSKKHWEAFCRAGPKLNKWRSEQLKLAYLRHVG